MIDHIGFLVSDFPRSKAFYEAALSPLGIGLVMDGMADSGDGLSHCGFGRDGMPSFWIGGGEGFPALQGRLHVAFPAPDRAAVRVFHDAALAVGGADNGGPGLRPRYHPNYYAAFAFDPDGHNIEAVCHRPE